MLKSHVMIAFGLLMAAIYAVRLASGFSLSNGVDLGEVYLVRRAGAGRGAAVERLERTPPRKAHPSGKLRPKLGCQKSGD